MPLSCCNVGKIQLDDLKWASLEREMMIRGSRGVMREGTAAKKLSTYFELLSLVGRTFFSCGISVKICPEIPYKRFIHEQSKLSLDAIQDL